MRLVPGVLYLPPVTKTVRVPSAFRPLFERAEDQVSTMFSRLSMEPERGAIHIDQDRYVLMRAESLYLAWFETMAAGLGAEAAYDFIYNTARAIGRADAESFAQRLNVIDGVEKLSAGPVHFAHAGWALVHIIDDSSPSPDRDYFLHYVHPNTFESEVLELHSRTLAAPGCYFSAGYSSGWCSAAFGLEVHGREIQCVRAGGGACEFVMGVADRLDELAERACESCAVPRTPSSPSPPRT